MLTKICQTLTVGIFVFTFVHPVFPQEQGAVEFFEDLGGALQTFEGVSARSVSGVELAVMSVGAGADADVEIRNVLPDNTLSSEVLGFGTLMSTEIPQSTGEFITIDFNVSVKLELGVEYALIVAQTNIPGEFGFVNFGVADGDIFSDGFLGFDSFSDGTLEPINFGNTESGQADLAFRFVTTPVPEPSAIPVVLLSACYLSRRKRQTD